MIFLCLGETFSLIGTGVIGYDVFWLLWLRSHFSIWTLQGSISDGENLPCTCSKHLKGRRHQVISYISITCPLQTGTARLTSPPSVRLLKTEWCHKFHVWKRQDIMIPASNTRDSGKISTLTHQPTFYMGIAKLIRGLGLGFSALLVDMVDFGSRLCT